MDTAFLLGRRGKLPIPLSPAETQAAKRVSGVDGRWMLAGRWPFQGSAGFRQYEAILPDAESKQRWRNHIFSARLSCAQEIRKVAFILQLGANTPLFRVS